MQSIEILESKNKTRASWPSNQMTVGGNIVKPARHRLWYPWSSYTRVSQSELLVSNTTYRDTSPKLVITS